uniref:Uncharacterized protein n=1 Tax=Megaviridae environmental sample TaxID=1737588 RepID=A0A5J6VJW0_9VIRU|nr:MAG: hypothetical protein [Megaviridae environmental sample]
MFAVPKYVYDDYYKYMQNRRMCKMLVLMYDKHLDNYISNKNYDKNQITSIYKLIKKLQC